MTKEELKAHCEEQVEKCEAFWAEDEEKLKNHKLYQEHRLILELLEQQPCEDCVSRQAVINQIFYSTDNSGDVVLGSTLRRRIENLPPVTSKRPKGEWIWKERTKGGFATYTGENTESGERVSVSVDERIKTKVNYCSVCGKRGDDTFFNFCPNCGADMRG